MRWVDHGIVPHQTAATAKLDSARHSLLRRPTRTAVRSCLLACVLSLAGFAPLNFASLNFTPLKLQWENFPQFGFGLVIALAEEAPPLIPPVEPDPRPALAEPSVEEIARIRQSFGALPAGAGGGDQAFVEALQRLAQSAEDTPSSISDAPVDGVRLTIATLRNSARELDLQAYEFDEQRNRAQSKRLRRLAHSLRREADRLEDHPSPVAPPGDVAR